MSKRAAIAVRESARDRLQSAGQGLASMQSANDPAIESLTRTFAELAGESSKVLAFAAMIVQSIEGDGIRSVFSTIGALGSSAISFVESNLAAAEGILENTVAEMQMLRRLSKLTRSQSGIALRTRVLAMLTNIEMGRLGSAGTDFEHVAGELTKFSRLLAEGTDDLERRTDARKLAIEASNRQLASEVPRLAGELTRIRAELGNDLTRLETGLAQIGSVPAQFQAAAEQMANQIAGAIAAIQSYDITRQQMEHARDAIGRMATEICGDDPEQRARASFGITIQIYQLQQIRDTVANWMSQMGNCLEGILKVSASTLAGIGPIVGECERDLSARLGHMDLLESESKTQSEAICHTVGEHATLVRLIDEQVKKAMLTRQTLHLLSLNTTIKADRLGERANAVLEIGSGIADLSSEWSRITDQSGQARQEISGLVEQVETLMTTFSKAEEDKLQGPRTQARAALEQLHTTSGFAARQACDIERGLEAMKRTAGGIAGGVDVLDRSYRQLEALLKQLGEVQMQLEADLSEPSCTVDREELKRHFSASYTTEIEREVLQAALDKATMPHRQQSLERNGVELF